MCNLMWGSKKRNERRETICALPEKLVATCMQITSSAE